ncbi:MAG TPA: SusE domain-containing protein [Balneolaceae bacterium]
MKSKLINIFAGIFILLAFVQCGDSVTPILEPELGQEQNLGQPQLLAPENGSKESTSLTFEWSKVDQATSYQIQLSTTEDFSSPIVDGTADSTSFKVTALPGDTTVFWKVRPLLQNEEGPWSETSMFNTAAEAENSEPVTTSLQSPKDGATKVPTNAKLQWTTVATASAYNLQLATDQNFSSIVVEEEVQEAAFQTTEVSTQTTYYWRVKPVVENEETAWSDTFSFETGTKAAGSVVLTSPENEATDQPTKVTLKWEEESSIDVYQVQLATDKAFASPIVDEMISDPSYEVADLKNSQTYYWRVQVAADENNENWSAIYEFTTEGAAVSTPPPTTSAEGIVTASNGDFMLNGEVFRFAGTNAYYLPTYQKINDTFVTNTLEAFEEAGVKVIRIWGFYDGAPQYGNDITIQPKPGQYNEQALRYLDQVIAKGKEHGIRFVVALINYWHELGGMPQYNEWDGNAGGGMKHFINDPDTQRWFKDYVKMLLNRTNTVTGVKYKNSSAIFSWEIMNEGRMPNGTPQQLRDWYQEMAQYIKSIDPNHMVTTGEEGFGSAITADYSVGQYANTYPLRAELGTSYTLNTSIPEIDYGGAHWYPSNWGYAGRSTSELIAAQRAWITDLSNIAEKVGKPFVLGEYGYVGWGDNTQLQVYKDMWETAEKIELDGSLIWQLTIDHVKCYEYGGNICWPSGRQDAELYNAFKAHIEAMSNSK